LTAFQRFELRDGTLGVTLAGKVVSNDRQIAEKATVYG